MQATKETVQKRPHTALWVILCVVLLCAAGAALYFCRWAEKPLTLAEGYVAAEGLTADITDGEGAILSQPVRGTKVTYVVEDEDKDHPGLVRLVLGEDSFGYLAREQLVTDPKDVVATKTIYVRTAVNLLDEAGAVPGRLVQKGEALTVTGWQDMDASGAVGRWQVEGGYIRAEYVTMDEPRAKAQYDQAAYQLHAERGDSWGGGDAAGLDYFPREKASFQGHPMPAEVKALYLNNESIAQAAEYVEVADSCGINAFVVDIMDGGAIAYPSEVMKQYSPSAYESAYNTLEVYQTGIKTLKDAGYYVIGRITAFNDPIWRRITRSASSPIRRASLCRSAGCTGPVCTAGSCGSTRWSWGWRRPDSWALTRSSSTICASPTAHGPSRRGPLTTATKTARARPKRCSDS